MCIIYIYIYMLVCLFVCLCSYLMYIIRVLPGPKKHTLRIQADLNTVLVCKYAVLV